MKSSVTLPSLVFALFPLPTQTIFEAQRASSHPVPLQIHFQTSGGARTLSISAKYTEALERFQEPHYDENPVMRDLRFS